MKDAVRMEIAKFFSTRMWIVLALSMVGYMVFLAAVMGYTLTSGTAGTGMNGEPVPELSDLDIVRAVYTVAVSLGYVFPLLIGTLAVTGEFRHRTIVPTLLFYPNRSQFVASKMIGALPMGFVFGALGIVSGMLAGAGVISLAGGNPMLGSGEVWQSVGLGVLAMVLWTVIGVGVGLVVNNQAAAVVIVLAFTQFVEPVARMALPAAVGDAGASIVKFLPGSAGDALAQGSIYSAIGGTGTLGWWQGALVLLAYGVTLALVGRVTKLRGDVN